MLEKKQDSTNSSRDFQVGGYSFNNNLDNDYDEQSIHIGHSPTFSFFYSSSYSGRGFFGVGQEPNNPYAFWPGQYRTIVSDGVLQAGSKFNFSGSVSIYPHDFPWESPYTIYAPITRQGSFVASRYSERHLFSSPPSISGSITSINFTDQLWRSNYFYVQNQDARAYRLLVNVNGIQRTSGTQSIAFSAYWDLVFGVRGGGWGNTFSFIGAGSYLNEMSRSSFISTGNLSLPSGASSSIFIGLASDGATDVFEVKVQINGTFSMIGSAKLTEVETGTIISNWELPT